MAIDLNNGFAELQQHDGHNIVCVGYGGDGDTWNMAIECETCGCVLLDFDNPQVEEPTTEQR